MRYAQNSFPSLITPSRVCLLELSPHAPFYRRGPTNRRYVYTAFITPGPQVCFCGVPQSLPTVCGYVRGGKETGYI
jgi:hypothetical protein